MAHALVFPALAVGLAAAGWATWAVFSGPGDPATDATAPVETTQAVEVTEPPAGVPPATSPTLPTPGAAVPGATPATPKSAKQPNNSLRPVAGFGAEDGAPLAPVEPGACMVRGPTGLIDLAPALRAIGPARARPETAGGVAFGNQRSLLPLRAAEHYHAFALPGEPIDGKQRLVIGQHGEVFYSRDGAQSFTRVSWRW